MQNRCFVSTRVYFTPVSRIRNTQQPARGKYLWSHNNRSEQKPKRRHDGRAFIASITRSITSHNPTNLVSRFVCFAVLPAGMWASASAACYKAVQAGTRMWAGQHEPHHLNYLA